MTIETLAWKSTEFKEFGGCVFFKASIPQTILDTQIVGYEINMYPILAEYTLYFMYGDDDSMIIGQYPTFESASEAANKHCQEYMKLRALDIIK